MKIGGRLLISFTLLLTLMIGMTFIGMYFNDKMSQRIRVVYEDRALPVQQLSAINDRMQRNRMLIMDMLLSPDRTTVRKGSDEFVANNAFIDKTWQELQGRTQTDAESELARTLQQRREAYFSEGLQPAIAAMRGDQYDEVSDLYLRKIVPLSGPVQAAMDQLIKLKIEQAEHEFEDSMDAKLTVNVIMGGVALLALLIGAWLSWVITRSITYPIAEAVRIADSVAGGDLTTDIVVHGRDESAEMLAALKTMHDGLVGIVSEVRQGSASIALGSREIATGSSELSQRTEEQAANLAETSAAMAQITSTVKHNADTAQQATRLAHAASAAALHGGEVVGQVVATMEQISQSSQRIADIISVIDGIAFQTNILALNAAVEAARAGDQGRGFAVVASEVRSLAQRSAVAAREIKALITESVQRVDVGSQLVAQAGDSVDGIVAQVKTVSELIERISHASNEQTRGLEQVNRSVAVLDGMTQHNAALVEESAAAAESLRHQAVRLDDAVRAFKVAEAA